MTRPGNGKVAGAENPNDADLRRRSGELRLDAYYYGFAATGVVEIDRILAAIACAGKGYHNTEDWNTEPGDGRLTYVEQIQMWAGYAAETIQQLRSAATPENHSPEVTP